MDRDYIDILESIAVRHYRKNYFYSKEKRERCSFVKCNKITKLQQSGRYKFCKCHMGSSEILTKEYNIKCKHQDEIELLLEGKTNSTGTTPIKLNVSSKEFIPVSKRMELIKNLDKTNQDNKNVDTINTKKECGVIGCNNTDKCKRKFGDWFCRNHIMEISSIRMFKKIKIPIDEEILLRTYEIFMRKKQDKCHVNYVKYLKYSK